MLQVYHNKEVKQNNGNIRAAHNVHPLQQHAFQKDPFLVNRGCLIVILCFAGVGSVAELVKAHEPTFRGRPPFLH